MKDSVILVSIFCIFYSKSVVGGETFELPILFPKDIPAQADSYLCTSVSVNTDNTSNGRLYIRAFTPVAEMSAVHHMLLYGCSAPGLTTERFWNCGGMLGKGPKNNIKTASACSGGSSRILYAWARNAPRLELPEDVAFVVGGDTEIQSLVLTLHEGEHIGDHHNMRDNPGAIVENGSHSNMSFNDASTDVGIGIILHVSHTPSNKLAGVFLLSGQGTIPPHETVHIEIACLFEGKRELHPFAFRTHSHALGKVISGYRVRRISNSSPGGQFQFEWTLIGKKNPQLPQMFYPVERDDLVIKSGDILAARCTMESNRTTTTYMGPTSKDEMCNFYIMYYVDDGKPLEIGGCFDPSNFWMKSSFGLNNVPQDASLL